MREVFAQQYELEPSGKIEPVKVHATGVVQNPLFSSPNVDYADAVGEPKSSWKPTANSQSKKVILLAAVFIKVEAKLDRHQPASSG